MRVRFAAVVQQQVGTQIKVRDFSDTAVTLKPVGYGSWSEVRDSLVVEAQKPIKARMQVALAACLDDTEKLTIKQTYSNEMSAAEVRRRRARARRAPPSAAERRRAPAERRRRAAQVKVAQQPFEVHMQLGMSYNVSEPARRAPCTARRAPRRPHANHAPTAC